MYVQQNSALFSLIGDRFGGDGRTTFALPDRRGRVPVHAGQGPGLRPYTLGEKGGMEETYLEPRHLGGWMRSTETLGQGRELLLSLSGGVYTALGLHQPYAVLNLIVALEGVFPTPY